MLTTVISLELTSQIRIFGKKKLHSVAVKKSRPECNFDAQVLNETFSNPIVTNNHEDFYKNSDLLCDGNILNFKSFSELEVYKAIYSIKSNAVGYDDIRLKFVKTLIPFILPTLTHIFNHITTTNIFILPGKLHRSLLSLATIDL